MSVHLLLRLFLMIILGLAGWALSLSLAEGLGQRIPWPREYYLLIGVLGGALIGFFGAPYALGGLYRALCRWLRRVPAQTLLMGMSGVVIGLVMAALLAIPLSMLPGRWGEITPLIAALVLATLGAMITSLRDRDILASLGLTVVRDAIRYRRNLFLLDTSAIIDGRIADISQTGFITGTLVVPRFVLNELQHVADSTDELRRNRGRRGLDVLNRLQKDGHIRFEILERDPQDVREVDAKLIYLAQELDCPIVTNDYNLNRVAELQGVQVLNINELANAVKSVVLPGEAIRVRIIQEGRELGQGVGYLDDGTMVVVEDGRRYLNMTVNAIVTRILQTAAGRMIFCHLPESRHEIRSDQGIR